MRSFTYDALSGRVVFGVGALARLREEVDRLGARSVLVVFGPATKPIADDAIEAIGRSFADSFTEIRLHVPAEGVERARRAARSARADCVVSIGGGSTIGYGKAIALESGLPMIAVPTTYSGSEMTPIYGITADGHKRTGRDLRVLPKVVVYDPALTVSLPPPVTGASGMNAIAHCVEGLYSKDANPITSLLAEEGIRVLARAIPASVHEPEDLGARTEALYGAYLAGATIAVAGMAIHHRICHVLGGTFGLAHADVNAVILPHVARFNEGAAREALAGAAKALGTPDLASGLADLAGEVGASGSLAELGMRERELDEAARLSVDPAPWNPRPVDRANVRALLDDAFHGRPPAPAGP